MRNALPYLLAALFPLVAASCRQAPEAETKAPAGFAAPKAEAKPWLDVLRGELPALGHRNWIVVADAAFPLQITPGMEILVSGQDHFEVLDEVLRAVAASKHIRPKVYLDKELDFVTEELAPGIDAVKDRLKSRLAGLNVQPVLHEELIARMDKVGQAFKIVMIKTNLTLPYTTVFLDLDCGYWPAEAEAKMRQAMKGR